MLFRILKIWDIFSFRFLSDERHKDLILFIFSPCSLMADWY